MTFGDSTVDCSKLMDDIRGYCHQPFGRRLYMTWGNFSWHKHFNSFQNSHSYPPENKSCSKEGFTPTDQKWGSKQEDDHRTAAASLWEWKGKLFWRVS